MSWNFKITAPTKEAFAVKMTGEPDVVNGYMPQSVVDAIAKAVEAIPDGCAISLDTHGHVDSHGAEFTIRLNSITVAKALDYPTGGGPGEGDGGHP